MKANELRRGNLILFNGEIFPIYGILNSESVLIGEDKKGIQEVFLHEIEPIILIEKLMLKFGFEYNEKSKSYSKGRLKIYKVNLNAFLQGNSECESPVFLRQIEFAHDLQNVYFDIHQEELITIK
jgi:hypothetical protein